MKPEYCENVIVGISYKHKFNWYITSKFLWRMDYQKEYQMWKEYYIKIGRTKKQFEFDVGSFQDFCKKRWGIEVLNEKNVDCFLKHIKKNLISTDRLHELFIQSNGRDLSLIPVFYVDFDNKVFCSNFPEPENYDDYVPIGWNNKYCKISSLVPVNNMYWNI